MEAYNSFVTRVLAVFGGRAPEILGILFFLMAMWLIFKRRQARASIVCFLISAGIAFGSTLYVYWRQYHG